MQITKVIVTRNKQFTSSLSHCQVIYDEGCGKKYTLLRVMLKVTTEWVWLIDDDVSFDNDMVEIPDILLHDVDLIILPLQMLPYNSKPTMLDALQIAEFAAIQQITKITTLKNHPILCNGANLLVRRKLWLESFSSLHPDIASGDDMFLLEYSKKNKKRIRYADLCTLQGYIRTSPSLSTLLHQRQRWAGKSIFFKDSDILKTGVLVFLANLIQAFFPPFLFIKFWPELILIKKNNAQISFGVIFLLEILYPYYVLFCVVSGIYKQIRSHAINF